MQRIEIPLLSASDIDVRAQQVIKSKNGVGAILLLYKDARVDMRILDDVFGIFGWQRSHEVVNGNLFCAIDIWDGEKKCWVRKQDVGTESNTEKEKGEASDSFKRAGTNVGIGRELYTSPFIWVDLEADEYTEYQGKYKISTKAKFSVDGISYNDRREINSLKIKDSKGKVRFSFGGKDNNINPPTDAQEEQPPKIPDYTAKFLEFRNSFCKINGISSDHYNSILAELYGQKKINSGKAENLTKQECDIVRAALERYVIDRTSGNMKGLV